MTNPLFPGVGVGVDVSDCVDWGVGDADGPVDADAGGVVLVRRRRRHVGQRPAERRSHRGQHEKGRDGAEDLAGRRPGTGRRRAGGRVVGRRWRWRTHPTSVPYRGESVGSPSLPLASTLPGMAKLGWTSSVGLAVGTAAGAAAAQFGLGYGLGIISWVPGPSGTPDEVWLASLAWATFIAATSTVTGAISGR